MKWRQPGSFIVHRSSFTMDDLLPYPFLAIVGQAELNDEMATVRIVHRSSFIVHYG